MLARALAIALAITGNENICSRIFRDVSNYPTRMKISPKSSGLG